jgi:hypothetical protein
MVFGHKYQDIFKEHFGDCVTDTINSQLWFAGKNIVYAIESFMLVQEDMCEPNDLLDFVEVFISKQLDDFGMIMMKMDLVL